MTIRYVPTDENKYVQARCMAQNFTTDTTQWAIAEEGIYAENLEFIYVKTDAENKILWAIKTDGSIYYGAGVPLQVINYVTEQINIIKNGSNTTDIDGINKIVAFLDGFSTSDTLKNLLNTKVDKVEGKSLIDSDIASSQSFVDNSEWIDIKTDSEGKILEGIKNSGTKVIDIPVEIQGLKQEVIDNDNWVELILDNNNKIIRGVDKNGKHYFGERCPQQIKDYVDETINSCPKLKNIIVNDSDIDELTTKINKSIEGNDLIFVHVTDTHCGRNNILVDESANFMNMAAYLATISSSVFLCHTGDAIDGYSSTSLNAFDSYKYLFSLAQKYPIPIIFAEGNYVHDFGYQGEIDRKQVQSLSNRYKKWLEDDIVYNDSDIDSYYYFDIKKNNIRVIVLDAQDFGENRKSYGFSSQQVTFVENALLDALQHDIKVLFFAHMPPYKELFNGGIDYNMGVNSLALRTAIGEFTTNGGKVIAYIYGHMHTDNFYYDNNLKVPFVCLACGAVEYHQTFNAPEWGCSDGYVGAYYGNQRYIIDVYSINTETSKLNIFRFGVGNNRFFSPSTIEISIAQNVSLTTQLTGDISWYINDSTIATISNGVVTGVNNGYTWAMAQDGKKNKEFYNIHVM